MIPGDSRRFIFINSLQEHLHIKAWEELCQTHSRLEVSWPLFDNSYWYSSTIQYKWILKEIFAYFSFRISVYIAIKYSKCFRVESLKNDTSTSHKSSTESRLQANPPLSLFSSLFSEDLIFIISHCVRSFGGCEHSGNKRESHILAVSLNLIYFSH